MSYDCYCDYDYPEFYCAEIKTARKRHQCEECRGPILPGEKYERVAGKWDGMFGTFRTCSDCVDIRKWTQNNVPCLCWAHGNIIEDCLNAIEEAQYRAPDETVGLRFGFRRRQYIAAQKRKQRLAA